MKGKAILVSGVNRSGTSVAMHCLSKKYQIIFNENMGTAPKEEIEGEIQNYTYQKKVLPNLKEKYKRLKEMNPNGFFETENVQLGLFYTPNLKGVDIDSKIIKIVSNALNRTDPNYVKKVIYMLRDPLSVMKSQEKLVRGPIIKDRKHISEEASELGSVVNSSSMFIRDTYFAAKFFIENPSIPVLVVNYNNLIAKPKNVLDNVCQFIDNTNSTNSMLECIDPNLKRSTQEPSDVKDKHIELAQSIYTNMEKGDFLGVVSLVEKYDNMTRENPIFCHRLNRRVSGTECDICFKNKDWVAKQKKTTKADWVNEPCTRECLTGMSIAESIKFSHWR